MAGRVQPAGAEETELAADDLYARGIGRCTNLLGLHPEAFCQRESIRAGQSESSAGRSTDDFFNACCHGQWCCLLTGV